MMVLLMDENEIDTLNSTRKANLFEFIIHSSESAYGRPIDFALYAAEYVEPDSAYLAFQTHPNLKNRHIYFNLYD